MKLLRVDPIAGSSRYREPTEYAPPSTKPGTVQTIYHLALATLRAWLTSCTTIVGDEFNSYILKSDEQVAHEAAEYTKQATRLLRAGYTGPDTPERLAAWLLTESEHIAAQHAVVHR